MARKIKSVLFDLDGTLMDTAADLGAALNKLLVIHGLKPIPLSIIRPAAGRGSRGLLKLGFQIEDNDARFNDLSNQFLDLYDASVCDTTQFFPGMPDVLQYLETNNIPWGIVTNKPKRFTDSLIQFLQLEKRAQCIISGDTLSKRKPYPDPILHACQLINCNPNECLYIGDAEIDIIAGRAAGTVALVALYGYISPDENPYAWNADGHIKEPLEIKKWLLE